MSLYTEPKLLGFKVGKRSADPSLTYRRVEDLVIQTQFQNALSAATAVGLYEPAPERPGGKFPTVAATCELVGHTVATDPTPPPWGVWFRARGAVETQTGASSTKSYTYTLGDPHLDSTHTTGGRTGDCDAISFIFNLDGRAETIDNAVAESLSFEWVANEIPKVRGSFRGVIGVSSTAPTDTTLPTMTAEPVAPVSWDTAGFSLNPNAAGAITSLLVSRFVATISGGLDETLSASGVQGFGQPRLTKQITEFICEMHEPDLSVWNIDAAFAAEHEIAITFKHDDPGGNGRDMTISGDFKLKAIPERYDVNGVRMVRLRMQQSQDASATAFNIAIQST